MTQKQDTIGLGLWRRMRRLGRQRQAFGTALRENLRRSLLAEGDTMLVGQRSGGNGFGGPGFDAAVQVVALGQLRLAQGS